MHTENPRVLKNLIEQLPPYIIEDSISIPNWHTYTGVHTEPGKIELDGTPAREMTFGDHWFAGYDETRYFEATVRVPDSFKGRTVRLNIDFGGEAIVRINNKIVGAVSSRENCGWVGRNDILFKDKFNGGEELFIQVEGTVDSAGFCTDAINGKKGMEYTVNVAELDLINDEAEGIYYDFLCAFEIYEKSEDRYVAKRLYNIIDNAIHKLDFDFGKERYYGTIPAAHDYFWAEAAKINSATPGEVILAGHSHLDVAWLWTVKEIYRKTARTFSNNIALLDNYPDFHFTQSQAVIYDFMKEKYPEVFERVKEYVKDGRWEIIGNTWVEADTNLASGESLIRQLLYGREFFLKEFGVSSDTYWLPDCFGFTAALPQIIKKSGMKYFITSKLQYNDTNEFPLSVFKWRSHSGDEVLAYMQKVHYEGDADANYIIRTRSTNRQNDLVDASMGMFGYGDGGGGCTYNMVERIRRFEKLPGVPKTREGRASDFFKEVEKGKDELPVWDGEMYYENHRGTFTSQAFIKKNNRQGEYMLRNAEFLGIISGKYDKEKLEKAWKILLINQFHDILPGTSIHEAIENTRKEYGELKCMGNELIENSLTSLNENAADGKAIVVWNFGSHEVSDVITVDMPFPGAYIENTECEITTEDGVKKLIFKADNIPPMGYKVFKISEKATPAEDGVLVDGGSLENEYLKVAFDENGLITSVFDKKNEREVLYGKGNLLTISHDKPIHESAWNLESDYKMKMWKLEKAESITVIENTPLRGTIEIVRKFNESVITQKVSLKKGSRTLDFDTTVDWHEREKVLKAEFPVNIRSRFSTFEIAHGALERPTYANNSFEKAMFECCAHKWTDLSEGNYGVSLLNDCKYGYDIDKDVLRITLMRGPVNPDKYGDIGISTFKYSLYPHENRWNDAGTVAEGFKLNLPLKPYFVENGKGTGEKKSFVTVDKNDVIIDAFKQAQDGNGIILRMYEAEGKHTNATVKLPFSGIKVTACNLMEENENEIPANSDSFSFTLKPFEVTSFRIEI